MAQSTSTKILAHPVDDKRKASSIDLTFSNTEAGGGSAIVGYTDIVDIRGFANFTIIVKVALTQTGIIKVSHSTDNTTFRILNSLGAAAAAIAPLPAAEDQAYDVPELAGCHYLQIVQSSGTISAGTITIMGKV